MNSRHESDNSLTMREKSWLFPDILVILNARVDIYLKKQTQIQFSFRKTQTAAKSSGAPPPRRCYIVYVTVKRTFSPVVLVCLSCFTHMCIVKIL